MLLSFLFSSNAVCEMLHEHSDNLRLQKGRLVGSESFDHLVSVRTLRVSPVHLFDASLWSIAVLRELCHHDHQLDSQVRQLLVPLVEN
jgi:hypothetical protein